MQPLLTQAHFDLMLASLLNLLTQAITPKETFAASDRIARLAALHHKLYIQPEKDRARQSKSKETIVVQEPETKQAQPLVQAQEVPLITKLKTKMEEVKAELQATEQIHTSVGPLTDQAQKKIWHDTLPDECFFPALISPQQLQDLDPESKRHIRLGNLGIISLVAYRQMQQAGMIEADGVALTQLAKAFYEGE